MLYTMNDLIILLKEYKKYTENKNEKLINNEEKNIVVILSLLLNKNELKLLDEILLLGDPSTNIQNKRKKQFKMLQTIYIQKTLSYVLTNDIQNALKINSIIIFLFPFLVSNNSLQMNYRSLWSQPSDYPSADDHFSQVLFKEFSPQRKNAPNQEESAIKEFEQLSRNDFAYKRIESYKEFEFNHCIAYEFAKRKHPLLDKVEIDYLKDLLDSALRQCGKIEIDDFINSKTHYSKDFLDKLNFDTTHLDTTSFKKAIQYFLKKVKVLQHELAFSNSSMIDDTLIEQFKDNEIFTNFFERFFTITKQAIKLNMEHVATDYDIYSFDERIHNNKQNNTNNHFNFVGINNKAQQYSITPTFNTPPLFEAKKWEVNLKINLALCDDELLKYIQHIKKQLMSEQTTSKKHYVNDIKTLKLMTSQKSNCYSNDCTPFEIQKHKIATMLFIYDCYLVGLQKNEIIQRCNSYHKSNTISTINKNSYYQYLNYAKLFIEEEKYKGLVDGSFIMDDFSQRIEEL